MNYSFKSIDKANGRLVIDSKGINDGYFFAAIQSPTPKRLKLRVQKNNDVATYDLKNDGTFEMFSLQFGSGNYNIILYENIAGTKYAVIGNIYINVLFKDANAPFLVPNQYINYNEIPELISLTNQLCEGKTKQEKYNTIKKFIKDNIKYDFIKAAQVKKGMLPDIKGLLKKKIGICYDIASLAVAMLRISGIPAKLVIGMADKNYHAWVEIINNSGKILRYDPTFDIYNKKVNKYIIERYY